MSNGIRAEDVLSDEANEILLDSGLKARKGTVLAAILNIRKINQLFADGKDFHAIQATIAESIPILKSLHLFELFSLEEWLSNVQNVGRFSTGLLYLKYYPEEGNPRIKSLLYNSLKNSPTHLVSDIENILIKIR